MNKHAESEEGYIVFEDGGTSPIAYGASEKWFSTYDEATKYALNILKRRVQEFKEIIDLNSVIIYEGPEAILHESHSFPPKGSRVVFCWSNYYRRL